MRATSAELGIRGFDLACLDDSQIDEFWGKLRDVRKKRKAALDDIQVKTFFVCLDVSERTGLSERRRCQAR